MTDREERESTPTRKDHHANEQLPGFTSREMSRRDFGQILAGIALLPALPAYSTNGEANLSDLNPGQEKTGARLPSETSGDSSLFEHTQDGSFRWNVGNRFFNQQLSLKQGRFTCTSLQFNSNDREWIHPSGTSDEFCVEISKPGDAPQALVGQDSWTYLHHSVKNGDRGWNHLTIEMKPASLPIEIQRHYLWRPELPLLRQYTTIKNSGSEVMVVHRLDCFRLRVSPLPDSLELCWINNFCRAMRPDPGNPIHYCSIDDNIETYLRTGPYSPDFAWFCLRLPGKSEGLIGGWEWSGPMAVAIGEMKDPCLIHGGLDAEGMAEPLEPGSSLDSPIGWYGFYSGDLDAAAALSHNLIRTGLAPSLPESDYPWVGYCSWSASLDENSPFNEKETHPWFPTEKNLLSQVEAAAELGCEFFLWDHGWFPQKGNWWCDPRRFPQGPKPLVDAVKKKGMKLGLWFGFGNADETSEVIRAHPDWLATYGGKPIPDAFFTRTAASVWNTRIICLAHRPAREWVKQQLVRVIEQFELDWLKHDFDLITICQDRHHTHTPGDGRLAACEGFYEIMDFVRQRFPRLICENWMNNSAAPDYGVVQRHHMQLIGDAYKAFALRQMVYGHIQVFPLDRQQRYIRFEHSEGDLKTMFRSGAIGGPLTLLSDPRRLPEEKRVLLKEEISLYKKIRRFFKGKAYRLIGRPHPRGWDAFELYDESRGDGVLYAFRNHHPAPRQEVILKGIDPNQNYRVTYHDRQEEKNLAGKQMMTSGIPVVLPEENSTELILFSSAPFR